MKKVLFVLGAALLLALAPFHADAAGVREREVEVTGSGATREKAVNDGLMQAVAQVTGLQLSAEDVTRLRLDVDSRESGDEGAFSRETHATFGEESTRQTHARMRGTVKSYVILSEEPSRVTEGYVDVRMSVVVSYFEADVQTQRKRIAVLPFRELDHSRIQKLFVVQLNQALTNYFTQTRNFAVLDRDYLAEKHAEFDLLQGDDIRTEERARVGNTLGTDYILVGSLTAFTANVSREKVPYVNEERFVVSGKAALAWRLVDAPTGQIAASGTHDEAFRQVLRSEAELDWLALLARPAGEEIGRKIVDVIYPIAVLSHQGGTLTLARGGDALAAGERFQLVRYGEVLMDPYTNEPLAREETCVGEVEIVDVAPKLSHARVLRCDVDLNGLEPRQFVLRPMPKAASGTGADKSGKLRPKTMQPKW